MSKTMAEVLEELWDAGNCTGLDGWIGPGRGAIQVDDVALGDRRRDVEKAVAALSAAGFGLVADAKGEALEEAAAERATRSDTYFQTMQNMAESREHELADIVRYGAYSAEAKSTATWLRARAAAVRGEG